MLAPSRVKVLSMQADNSCMDRTKPRLSGLIPGDTCPGVAFFLFIVLIWSTPVPADVRYVASIESAQWTMVAEPSGCSLGHVVPHYGQVVFRSGAIEGLKIDWLPNLPHAEAVAGVLYALPTDWGGRNGGEELGPVWLEVGRRPLAVEGMLAQRILKRLEQGWMVRLEYVDLNVTGGVAQVDLLPLRFSEAAADFLACGRETVKLDFVPVMEEQIPFASGDSRLGREQLAELHRIAEMYKAQPEGLKIVLGGHADVRGQSEANRRLAQARAVEVYDDLVNQGVPRDRIHIINFGSDWPLDPAENDEAWAKNRRVSVWFRR